MVVSPLRGQRQLLSSCTGQGVKSDQICFASLAARIGVLQDAELADHVSIVLFS